MAYDVFISYSRDDLDLCTEVFRLLERLGFHPFRDVDDLAGGAPWREQLQEALSQPDLEPSVLVLCTRAAVERPEGVVEEIRFARERKLPVIPVEIEPGAANCLLAAAGVGHPGQIQHIDATGPADLPEFGERLEDALRRTLTRKVRSWLSRQRALAKEWVDRLHQDPSFWETTWRDYFPLTGDGRLSGSMALTARGGSGKSVLIAHCVRSLLEDPDVYPVLIDEETLRDPLRDLARRLGARPSAAEMTSQGEALAVRPPGEHRGWKAMRVVFLVDGLDRMVTPDDDKYQTKLVNGLNLLVKAAPVLIGCRKEVWDSWYAGRVSVIERSVPELDEYWVRGLLREKTTFIDQYYPLLQVPFFLDTTLQKAKVWAELPRTETDFLKEIWSDAVQMLTAETGRRWLLKNLAECQLGQLVYDVSVAELQKRPGYLPDYAIGINKLKNAGLLVEQTRSTGPTTVRLRHDLLDNYSMVQVLLSASDTIARRRDLCRRCEKDCGWSLLASLVQAAHDWGRESLKQELFSEFLFILDHKPFGDIAMTRAWAVTHVLRACLHSLFGLILAALKGEPTASLDGEDPTQVELRRSSLDPGRLTQDTASTLASAFMVLHAGNIEDAVKAVPVLADGLARWEPIKGAKKGRFLDALGRYRTNESLDAIVSFARRQLKKKDDLGSLLYVAQNLRNFPQPAAADLLWELFADSELPPNVRREAAEGLNHLQPGRVQVPPLTEAEIVDGLKVRGRDERYSDWHEVQKYAGYVRDRIAHRERFSPRVLEALIAALKHDQTFVRRAVAQTLSLFDEPAARDALLGELLEPVLPAEVRSACLEALERQLQRLAEPRDRQAFRYLLLRAARAARQAGAGLVERGLSDLALRQPGDWSLTASAVEVLPPAAVPWTVRCSVAEAQVDPAVLLELDETPAQDVGPDHEPKYLFAGLQTIDGGLDVALAPTTWTLGKRFHNAVRDRPDRFLRSGSEWLVPMPLGPVRLPGLAVVHGIVLTSDGRVLLAQRSETLAYAPLHWSISFEEQVTEEDLLGGDRALHLAASRGMAEEFGVAADPSHIHLLSAVLEMDNLNLAAIVLIETAETLEQIRRSWSDEPRPSHAWEAQELDSFEADPGRLDALAGGADSPREPLHPTSRVRCAVLARWLLPPPSP